MVQFECPRFQISEQTGLQGLQVVRFECPMPCVIYAESAPSLVELVEAVCLLDDPVVDVERDDGLDVDVGAVAQVAVLAVPVPPALDRDQCHWTHALP